MLIDTSILIPVFRDKTGGRRHRFRKFLRGRSYVISRFTQIELLQGCRNNDQWDVLADYTAVQDFAELQPESWADAARIHFDLKRRGRTVRSIHDCLIAQLAIDHKIALVHNDNDFEAIADVRKLRLHRLDLQ